MNYYSQAGQDKFIINILKEKQNGFFLEIGSSNPIHDNNTFLAESQYNWKGIMIELCENVLPLYKEHRPNSIWVINDATKIDYSKLFTENNVPLNIDYLQIDLEESNGSTLQTLQKLDDEILNKYTFSTITFEHDIYWSNSFNTRKISREIFEKRGYVCVFKDVCHFGNPFEDWYIHPDFVDMEYVNKLQKL